MKIQMIMKNQKKIKIYKIKIKKWKNSKLNKKKN